jgi:hypothetical protein
MPRVIEKLRNLGLNILKPYINIFLPLCGKNMLTTMPQCVMVSLDAHAARRQDH